MTYPHAVVWLDHRRAQVIEFSRDDVESVAVRGPHHGQRIHHRAGQVGAGKEAVDPHFFADIAATLADADEVLICGPGNAKTAFMTYLETEQPALRERVAAVETVNHPTDHQLLAFARRSFNRIDQLGLS